MAKCGDRRAPLKPIYRGVRASYGGYRAKIALSLGLRMDRGWLYTADQSLGEPRWLGIQRSPRYVREPECNGVMERWIGTLIEEVLYLHDFATLEEARQVIGEFVERYNQAWLLERHGYRTPAELRASFTQMAA